MRQRKGKAQRRRQRIRSTWQDINDLSLLMSTPRLNVVVKPSAPKADPALAATFATISDGINSVPIPSGTRMWTTGQNAAGEVELLYVGEVP